MSAIKNKIVSAVTVSVEMEASANVVFSVAADHFKLSKWAHPVQSVRLRGGKQEVDYLLPDGVVTCATESHQDPDRGVVDWQVNLPKGEPIRVYSRVLPLEDDRSVYVLTLLSPPMPRRRLKDAYGTVQKNLLRDLDKFKELVGEASKAGKRRKPAKKSRRGSRAN